jgi:hypothetical protein
MSILKVRGIIISIFFPSVLLFLYLPAEAMDENKFMPVQPLGTFSTLSSYTFGEDRLGAMLGIEKVIDPEFTRFSLSVEYGLTENTDVLLNIPYVVDYFQNSGFQDVSIGFKQRIIPEKYISPSLSYLIGVTIPGSRGISTRGSIGGGLLISKKVGPFSGNINLFYFLPAESGLDDEIQFNMGFVLSVAHNFDIITEMIIKDSHFSQKVDLVEGRLGYRVQLSSGAFGAVGIGYDFKNRDPEWRVLFGISITYPEQKRSIRRIYEEE